MEPNSFNIFTCCDQQFDASAIMKHLGEAHGIERDAKGTKKMIMHFDASDWYQSNYEWTFGETVLHQSIRTEREEDDLMRIVHTY